MSLRLFPTDLENVGQVPLAAKTRMQQLQRPALGDVGNKTMTTTAAGKLKNTVNAALKKPINETKTRSKTAGKCTLPEELATEAEGRPSKDASLMEVDVLAEAFSSKLMKVDDIDREDSKNIQLVTAYVNDIYDYLRLLESKFRVKMNFLDGQRIDGRMRGILVDWLVQVHLRFRLLPETLYLTVAIIDRFLQVVEVSKNKLQLVGVTSMFLASKYEEMYAPEIGDFVYITDNSYTKLDIRNMEILILKTLDFSLGRPLPLHFLRRNSKAGEADALVHTLAKYLMELALVEYELCHYDPSHLAAASLCLSLKTLNNSQWTETLAFYSKYSERELVPLMNKLALVITKSENKKLQAVRSKYGSGKFGRVSCLPELNSEVIKTMAANAVS